MDHLAEPLSRLGTDKPNDIGLACPEGTYSYEVLARRTVACARGLRALGIEPGTRTVLMVKPGFDFVVLTFALIRIGAVIVLVDPGIGWSNLEGCLAHAQPQAFVGIPAAHGARVMFGWGAPTVHTTITTGRFPLWSAVTLREVISLGETGPSLPELAIGPDDTAAIVFTSGSTGPPKGVIYTHRVFDAQVALFRDHYGMEPGEVDVATFPLFALFDPALGITTVFPAMDFTRPGRANPRTILDTVQRYQATHMFASPALFRRLADFGSTHGIRLESLRRVLSAGAPVPADAIARFGTMLNEGAEIHTPYGATEALPLCSVAGTDIVRELAHGTKQGRGICVGKPLEGVTIETIGISDDPIDRWSDSLRLAPFEVGELVVRGKNVTSGYYDHPQGNAVAKIAYFNGHPTPELMHRMGDLGYFDEDGRVWLCGRKSQRVVTGDGPLFTLQCEGVFNQHPAVYRTALVGVGDPLDSRAVLCVELRDRDNWRGNEQLERELLELGAAHDHTRSIRTILFHRRFPVDVRHNAKIGREKLAVWARSQFT